MNEARARSALAEVEPIFYFDFSSPFAYLAATRIDGVLETDDRLAAAAEAVSV